MSFQSEDVEGLYSIFIGGLPLKGEALDNNDPLFDEDFDVDRIMNVDKKLNGLLDGGLAIDTEADYRPLMACMDLKKTSWSEGEKICIALRCFSRYHVAFRQMIDDSRSMLKRYIGLTMKEEGKYVDLQLLAKEFQAFFERYDENDWVDDFELAFDHLIDGKEMCNDLAEEISDDGIDFEIDVLYEERK